MSYELVFWRQDEAVGDPPEVVYRALNDGRDVDGLYELPIDDVLATVHGAFPGAVRESNGADEWVYWISSDEQASFEVTWSRCHVRVDCRSITYDDTNALIDIGLSFGCALYDPQINERFKRPPPS